MTTVSQTSGERRIRFGIGSAAFGSAGMLLRRRALRAATTGSTGLRGFLARRSGFPASASAGVDDGSSR